MDIWLTEYSSDSVVFSYIAHRYAPDEDDMVLDPLLDKHLAHWGINMMQVSAVHTGTGCSGETSPGPFDALYSAHTDCVERQMELMKS